MRINLFIVILCLVMTSKTRASIIKPDQIIGTWIGVSHQSVTIMTYKPDGRFIGSIQTPEVEVNLTFAGEWELKNGVIHTHYKESSSPMMRVPMKDNDKILEIKSNYMIVRGDNGLDVIFHRANFHRPRPPRSKWSVEPPMRLTTDFFRNARKLDDIDSELWSYLCDLIPTQPRSFRKQLELMFVDITPELKRYFLTRGFDWERGSGGLESCMMNDDDRMLIDDTIKAFEELGAKKQADIIRKLVPIAKQRRKDIEKAEKEGREFNFDPCPFAPFEDQWDKANEDYDFYEIIFRDMKKYPEKYCHPFLKKDK